jgi:enoyl-CoA hydratase/carnithine racemase
MIRAAGSDDLTAASAPVGLRLQRRGGVALITIDRPTSRNSLTLGLHAELVGLWDTLQQAPDVRAIVITGAEDPAAAPERQAFCAGADVAELKDGRVYGQAVPSLALAARTTPVIAAVNGYCIGSGFGLLLASDLRLAAPTASFGLPEVALRSVPGNGSVREATLELPHAVVMELLLRPGRMSAARALELGLINAIVVREDLVSTALEWADEIAALPEESARAAMELVTKTPRLAPADAAELERATLVRLHAADSPQ